MKYEYAVVYENSSDKINIGQCQTTVGFEIFSLLQYKLSKRVTQIWYKLGNSSSDNNITKYIYVYHNIFTHILGNPEEWLMFMNPGQNPTLTKPHRTKPHTDKTPSVIFS